MPNPPISTDITQLLTNADAIELVRAAQQNDALALTRIYHLYAHRVYRYIYSRIENRPRAEELSSEVFLRLLKSIGNYRLDPGGETLALTAWIYRIAHNLIIDEYRRRQVRLDTDSLPEGWEDTVEPELIEDFYLTRADLSAALQRLTHEQQSVILLRFGEGLTSTEIARILGKTVMAIKALQRRALAALARSLALDAQGDAERE